ncbi:MAG: hypothetical protein ABSF34_00790, partial [Verrucomicrobiota bacterium]
NRRQSSSRGKLFFRLLEQAVQVGPVTHDAIVGKTPKPPRSLRRSSQVHRPIVSIREIRV